MKLQKRNKTITTYLITVVAIIVIVQFTLITGCFAFGGILSGIRENAYLNFDRVVNNRVTFFQNEINNRWTSINPSVYRIREKLASMAEPERPGADEEFFLDIEPDMLAMMKEARVTDCYVILGKTDEGNRYPALYFRDEEPNLNPMDNHDLRLIAGPSEMAERYQIAGGFSEQLELGETQSELFKVPYQYGSDLQDYLGYWSGPFRFNEKDSPRIGYSMPLVDDSGEARGVIGIAVSAVYMNSFFPTDDMSKQDSLGYIIGRSGEDGKISPVIVTNEHQESILDMGESLDMVPVGGRENVCVIKNCLGDETIYGCKRELNLYSPDSPFAKERWYLIGLQEEGELLEMEFMIKRILFGAMVVSLIFSAVVGCLGFYKFTRPIAELAKKVNSRKISEEITLERTGFYELDELEEAIETEHRNFMDAQNKISQVVDLVDIPIGVFRYKHGIRDIMVTTKLASILGFTEEEKGELLQDSAKFLSRLHRIMENEDAEHAGIYKISEDPEKWIKINVVEQERESLGIVIDITEEQQETAKLRKERNYDVLTGLSSRRYFRDCVRNLLEEEDLGVCAGIMLDVDDFKQINDKYGHAFGDKYLKETARCLREICSTGCIAGRRSGDEFCAFLYDFGSREEIRSVINEFYRKLRDRPMLFPDRTNQIIEVSIGIVWYDKETMNYDSMLDKADQALYQAKENFKGYYVEAE